MKYLLKQITLGILASSVSIHAFTNDQIGTWGPVLDWNLIPIHSVLTPQGKLMSYGTNDDGVQGSELYYSLWDPTLGSGPGSRKLLENKTPTDIFCAAQVVLPQTGEVLLAGGDNSGPGNWGSPDTTLFNGDTESLSASRFQMAAPRWYPTTTTLPNGEILVQGGSNNGVPGTGILTPEIYNLNTGWRSLLGASSAYAYGDNFKRWWYPRSWILPDGRLFGLSGPAMYFLNYRGNGSITQAGTFDRPNLGATSTAVMYEPGKILQVGGGHFQNGGGPLGSNQASIIDVTGTSPVIFETQAMHYKRHWANSTLLPNGQVLVTGGSHVNTGLGNEGPAKHAEVWNPATGQWTVLAAEQYSRLYHSTAILLPDATVLSGGGGAPGPETNLNAQIYYPPYLYNGNNLASRPSYSLTAQQKNITYGQELSFPVNSANPISKVTLIKTGSVTHSFNSDQRIVDVDFSVNGSTLTVQLPSSPNDATPGYYMLFVLDSAGTPSIAEILHLPPSTEFKTNLVADGGFESISPAAGGFLNFYTGSKIGPWTLEAGGVSIHSNTHHGLGAGGASGSNHLDLNGPTTSNIQQTISGLQAGKTYTLSFDYAVHSVGGGVASAEVSVGDLTDHWTATNIGSNKWLTATYVFTATTNSEVLSFKGTDGARCCGVLIDNVDIRLNPDLVVDGGFESANPAEGGWINYHAGDSVGPWEVTEGGISIHSNTHNNLGAGGASGFDHLDLNGPTTSNIKQTISGLKAGENYTLSFNYAVHNLGSGASARVSIAELAEEWSATNVGSSEWLSAAFTFTATATSEELSFSGISGARCCGVLIDDVQIHLAPKKTEFVADGGFESSNPVTGGWINYNDEVDMPGPWEVTTGGISVHSNTHNNLGAGGASGLDHLDLNGPTVSNIQQTIYGLQIGTTYTLSFDYAVHNIGGGIASAEVSISNLTESWDASNIGSSNWLNARYTFTATATSEILSFKGIGGAECCGVLIDNVSITR